MAAVQLPDGSMLSPDMYNVIQGMLNSIAQGTPALAETAETAKQALAAAFESQEIVQLADLPNIVGEAANKLMGWMNTANVSPERYETVKELIHALWESGVSGTPVTSL